MRLFPLLLLALLLAACSAPAARQPVSPLPVPQHAVSPLPGPRTLVLARPRTFVPLTAKSGLFSEDECSLNPTAAYTLRLIREASWQRRDELACHPLLALAAQRKAQDMLNRRYFGHTSPTGMTANQNVLSVGYPLPDYYVLDNNVESIGLNFPSPQAMIDAWAFSPSHGPHLTGSHAFFAEQTCGGVGFAQGAASRGVYYVFISAPCP